MDDERVNIIHNGSLGKLRAFQGNSRRFLGNSKVTLRGFQKHCKRFVFSEYEKDFEKWRSVVVFLEMHRIFVKISENICACMASLGDLRRLDGRQGWGISSVWGPVGNLFSG